VTSNLNSHKLLEIFQQYNGQIYGYVYLRTGRNKEVAEDLTQDIFVKAWKSRQQFDSTKASLKTWLFTIARNQVIDYWRKSKIETLDDQALGYVEGKGSQEMEAGALSNFIYQELRKLDAATQDLIMWRYVNGLDIEEIAQLTGKNYNATKVAIHRALNTLKELVNGNQ
jgi:RNA polymerase sigma-70 factor, ECF subfamily